jgi:hypothetical protein
VIDGPAQIARPLLSLVSFPLRRAHGPLFARFQNAPGHGEVLPPDNQRLARAINVLIQASKHLHAKINRK